jgi:hypothetical protein
MDDSGQDKVADPGFGVFLTTGSGSGVGFYRIPDLGSQTQTFDSLMTIFGLKYYNSKCLGSKKFATIIYNFMIFVATKNGKTKKCSPSFFGAVMDPVQDPRSWMDKN